MSSNSSNFDDANNTREDDNITEGVEKRVVKYYHPLRPRIGEEKSLMGKMKLFSNMILEDNLDDEVEDEDGGSEDVGVGVVSRKVYHPLRGKGGKSVKEKIKGFNLQLVDYLNDEVEEAEAVREEEEVPVMRKVYHPLRQKGSREVVKTARNVACSFLDELCQGTEEEEALDGGEDEYGDIEDIEDIKDIEEIEVSDHEELFAEPEIVNESVRRKVYQSLRRRKPREERPRVKTMVDILIDVVSLGQPEAPRQREPEIIRIEDNRSHKSQPRNDILTIKTKEKKYSRVSSSSKSSSSSSRSSSESSSGSSSSSSRSRKKKKKKRKKKKKKNKKHKKKKLEFKNEHVDITSIPYYEKVTREQHEEAKRHLNLLNKSRVETAKERTSNLPDTTRRRTVDKKEKEYKPYVDNAEFVRKMNRERRERANRLEKRKKKMQKYWDKQMIVRLPLTPLTFASRNSKGKSSIRSVKTF